MAEILMLIIASCLLLIMVFIGFALGAIFAVKFKKSTKSATESLTEKQKLEIERGKKEYMNFLNYNGKEQ